MRARLTSKLKISLDPRAPSDGLELGGSLLQGAGLGHAHDSSVLATLASPPDGPGPLLAAAAETASPMLAAAPEVPGPILTPAPETVGPMMGPVTDVAEAPSWTLRKLIDTQRSELRDPRAWVRMRLVADAAMLFLASTLALLASGAVARSNWWLATAFPLVTLALISGGRNPEERLRASLVDAAAYVLGVISLAAMLTVAAGSIIGTERHVAFAIHLWVLAALFVGIERMVLFSIRRYALARQALATPTLIVGAGAVGARLAMRLFADPTYGLQPAGFLDTDPLPRPDHVAGTPLVPVLGGPNDLPDAIARTGARHVILAFTTEPDHVLVEKVKECQTLGVAVSLVPRMYEAINERVEVDHVGGLPLLSLHRTDPYGWKFSVKHALDRCVAAVLVAAATPLMVAVAVAVRLTSPGPVLFRQRRVGRDGREFDVLKFRTMRELDSAPRFIPPDGCAPGGVEGVDRRTPLGRWLRGTSLDELPQLLNVLRGDMSLVGPRPERPEYVARFDLEIDHYSDRRRVKSGITGWAQVHGLRGQTSIADRVEWDNYYIENWSLRLDLRIMLLTIAEVFRLRDTAISDAQD